MKFPRLLTLLLLLPNLALGAASPEPWRVRVFGNDVYADDTIKTLAGLEFAEPLTDDEIRQKLETSGYFSRVRVSREGRELTIRVQEKTPWFIFPFAAKDSGKFIYGVGGGLVGILGSSAMGLGRFQTGSDTKAASLFLRDDFFLDSFWILGLSLDYEHALRDVYAGRDVQSRWRNKQMNYSLQVGYHFTPDFLVQLNTNYEVHRFADVANGYSSGVQVSHRLLAEFGRLYVNEGLTSGYKLRPYLELSGPGSDYSFYQVGFFGQHSIYRKGELNWVSRPRFEWGSPLPRYQQFQLGGAFFRSFPAQVFRTQKYFAVQNDFFLTGLGLGPVTFRPMLYADWGYIENGGRTGVGAGLYMYFKQVAMPALRVYGGYGFRPNGFSFSAAVGPQI